LLYEKKASKGNRALSVVIPLFNEAESLNELTREILQVCDAYQINVEIILIDDGSTDETFSRIESLHRLDQRIKGIQFRRNRGKADALAAGFDAAKGNLIVTMDGDLQDDPAEIPKLIEQMDGYDMISGWKKRRKDPLSKRIPPAA
jgi:glycosyltransferase involved in cell wall biosynthesis